MTDLYLSRIREAQANLARVKAAMMNRNSNDSKDFNRVLVGTALRVTIDICKDIVELAAIELD